jgi:hypothetical protein
MKRKRTAPLVQHLANIVEDMEPEDGGRTSPNDEKQHQRHSNPGYAGPSQPDRSPKVLEDGDVQARQKNGHPKSHRPIVHVSSFKSEVRMGRFRNSVKSSNSGVLLYPIAS